MEQHVKETVERWTAKRHAALGLRILKGETSVAEAARQHGLTVAAVEGWQVQFLHAAENGLGNRNYKRPF
jgi:transposase-like protein